MLHATGRPVRGNKYTMKLGDRLRLARQRSGLSQKALAESVGIGQSAIASIERGDTRKSTNTVSLARTLDCDPYWLETGEGTPEATYPRYTEALVRAAIYATMESLRSKKVTLGPEQFADVVVNLCDEFGNVITIDDRLMKAYASGALAHHDV